MQPAQLVCSFSHRSMFSRASLLRRNVWSAARNFSSGAPSGIPRSRVGGPVTMVGLGLTVVVGAGVMFFYDFEKEKKMETVMKTVKTVGKPALGGPWVLVDTEGRVKTDEDFKGRFTLLYFGFTYCPDICPSELVKVGKIVNELEKRKCSEVTPIFISVDPGRDSIGQLKHYGQDFHKSIVYLTGTKEQVGAAARAYRVYFSKANENELNEEDYLVDHSIVLYLVSPEGEFVDFFTQKLQVGEISDKIQGYIAEAKKPKPAVAAE